AGLAAFVVVGMMPQPLQGSFAAAKPDKPQPIVPQQVLSERVAASVEPIAFADRVPAKAEAEPVAAARAVPLDPPAAAPPTLRALDPEEIAMLVKRSEDLIAQGDIAAARLMLTRAAEAGDAR